MSVKIVDIEAPKRPGDVPSLGLTPQGQVFFNQFHPSEKLKFVSFIGAGRVGKSWLASRFAEYVWYETVLQTLGPDISPSRAAAQAVVENVEQSDEQASGVKDSVYAQVGENGSDLPPVPWVHDVFRSCPEGDAITKGIWAFALRPNSEEDEEEVDVVSPVGGGGSRRDDSPKSSRSPKPTIVILDCEGSDNLLDTTGANTIAKQIQVGRKFCLHRRTLRWREVLFGKKTLILHRCCWYTMDKSKQGPIRGKKSFSVLKCA